MDTQKQCRKSIALEFISTHPHTTGGTEKIVFAVKSVRLRTLTEIRSTFNSGQGRNVAKALRCTAFRVENPTKLQSTIQKALTIKKGPVVIETLTDVNSIAKGAWVPS